jgi:ribosome biogenesis protein Tsr3
VHRHDAEAGVHPHFEKKNKNYLQIKEMKNSHAKRCANKRDDEEDRAQTRAIEIPKDFFLILRKKCHSLIGPNDNLQFTRHGISVERRAAA